MSIRLQIRSFSVSVVVLRYIENEVETLVLKRSASGELKDAWCQIAGAIKEGESAWAAAVRELREETDLVPEELYSAGTCEQFYDSQLECIHMIPVFVAYVDSQAIVTLNHEHTAFKWISFSVLEEYIVTPNQREMFTHVQRHFVERKPTEWSKIDFRD